VASRGSRVAAAANFCSLIATDKRGKSAGCTIWQDR